MDDVPPLDKPGLRRWAKAHRSTLDRNTLTPLLLARLQKESFWVPARHILLYLAMPDEVNVEALLSSTDGRQFYVPRCAPNRRLAVHRFVPGETPLRPGPFDLREPDPVHVPESNPEILDLILVPALLLSRTGERLGYGGGYYDRFLPKLPASCQTVGLLPSALVLPELPRDDWDVPLNYVVTETKTFSGRSVSAL